MRKFPHPSEYGGTSRIGRRKIARPFSPKKAMHVTMRSTKAKGAWNFRHDRNRGVIHLLLLDTAERYDIKIYRWENVFNHVHLVLSARRRKDLQAFLRVFAQRLMFAVTGARKGRPRGRFFDAIAWSRIVEWGREFDVVMTYVWKNTLEALEFTAAEVKEMVQASKSVPI